MSQLARTLAEAEPKTSDALEALIRAHLTFVWRLLRRLGLSESDADDAAQQVFMVACRRFESIKPGSERAFLYGCALNKAARWRAAERRRCQSSPPQLQVETVASLTSEELLERKKARQLLDAVLEQLPEDLRIVFVLYEIEELTTHEIADLLRLPRGTVASRLRRARATFEAKVQRLESRFKSRGVEK